MPDLEKLSAVREALPATDAGIYLNTGSVGPLPRETARAMAEFSEHELTLGRGSEADHLDALERMAEARAALAAILTADVGTVALTHSATEAMNVAAWGLDWEPGDRAVTTTLEHVGGLGPLLTLRDRRGIDLRLVDIGNGGDDDATLAAFDRAIDDRTRLVVLSHVCWTTGAVLPVRAIADLAHARGALVLVDGAQAAGAIPVDVGALGADAYAVSGHKWLLGPDGLGALWAAESTIDRLRPTFAGWLTFDEPGLLPPFPAREDARRFEWGNFHRPSVIGLARSCGWLAMYVGLEFVYRRGADLVARTIDALAAIPGVDVVTPGGSGPLIAFSIAGWPAEAALEELGRRAFIIARTIPETDQLRFSVGFFNTEDELDRAVAAVEELARHTPETLPRRPTLAMLGEAG